MPNRLSAGAIAVGLALLLVACGGGDDTSSDGASSTTGARPTSTTSTTADDGAPVAGCADLTVAAAQLDKVPLFLQLDSPERVIAIRSGQLGHLDLDAFFRAMVLLHRLDGSTSPLGDPRDAITAYERAAVDAKPLFAAPIPDQAAINAYQDSLGDPGAFLSYQTPIAAALTDAGC